MISPQVIQELITVRQVLHYLPASPKTEKGWTQQEQQLFWDALSKFPQGPWTTIAEYIGSKSTRQAMTHGQKLRQKLNRWRKRLRRTPAAALALAESSGEMLDDDVRASIALSSVMMTSSAMTSMMMRNTSPLATPASMAMAMPTLTTTATSPSQQQHHNRRIHDRELFIVNDTVLPLYKTRASAMLTTTSSGLTPITTAGLSSDISYSELLMASLPFATSGIASFSTSSEAVTSAAFDRVIAAMTTAKATTNPSLPAFFVSSERHAMDINSGAQHHHNVRQRSAVAMTSAPMTFEDDGVRYALPQSMVDELADVLWD
ncbi:hypothetical protein Gpo141_00007118 [Globisporangium polare]